MIALRLFVAALLTLATHLHILHRNRQEEGTGHNGLQADGHGADDDDFRRDRECAHARDAQEALRRVGPRSGAPERVPVRVDSILSKHVRPPTKKMLGTKLRTSKWFAITEQGLQELLSEAVGVPTATEEDLDGKMSIRRNEE